MAFIKIKNETLTAEILTAEAGPGSGIAKYFKGDIAGFISTSELALAFDKSIATLAPSPLGLGLNFAQQGHFGTSGADWTLQASARVTVNAAQSGKAIPGDAVFAKPIVVDAGKTFLALAFSPTLSIGISGALGELQFGFSAGGSVEFRSGRFFDVATHTPKLGEAVRELLTTGIVPGDLDDLQQMRPGDVASVSGSGQFKLSAKFDVVQALNPLTTPTLGLEAIGALKVSGGASLSIGANVGVSGRYQIRVVKTDADHVRLGLFKMSGTQFGFDVKASAGLSASLGKRELTEKLMGLLGAAKEDTTRLVDAGLSDEQIADIKTAVEASLSRTIAVSLSGSFASSSEKDAVLEYDFDLPRLGAAGSDALHRALEADFSPLTSLSSGDLPAGVKMLASAVETMKKRSITWRVNLLGIVNVLRVSTLVKSGKVLFDAETGELVVTDSATANEITIVTNALVAQPDKLRKVLLQSAVLTAAYRASGAEKSLRLGGSISYYDEVANATMQNVSDFLDNLVGLLLITEADKAKFKDHFLTGRASVFVEVQFNQKSFEGMFEDPGRNAHDQKHYDLIGRMCLAQLIQPGDPDDFRRIPATDNELWDKMVHAGQPNFQAILPEPLHRDLKLALIIHDYTVIRWWSQAMSEAAQRVKTMKTFVEKSKLDAELLKDNKEFIAKRRDLHDALAGLVKQSTPDFLDAWGVLAMYTAARRVADVRGIVLTTGPILSESRTIPLAASA